MDTHALFGPSKLPVVTPVLTEILDASFDTPKLQRFWGIVRNIPLLFSSFARSQVIEGKTTRRHERSSGMPWEWVRKTTHFGGICAQIAFDTERKGSLVSAALT
jgi:hypothetical protein